MDHRGEAIEPQCKPSAAAEQHDASARPQLQDWLSVKQNNQPIRIGVSFRNLDCVGRRHSAQYHGNFLSTMLRPFRSLQSRDKVQILSRFEGLIRPGEMLLVLGRPGSGCSTFLKALAGETHGFQLGTESIVDYEGMSCRCTKKTSSIDSESHARNELRHLSPQLLRTADLSGRTRCPFPRVDTWSDPRVCLVCSR